jgi:hypothetical protein
VRIRRGPATVREGAASYATRDAGEGEAARGLFAAPSESGDLPSTIDGRLSAENGKVALDVSHRPFRVIQS